MLSDSSFDFQLEEVQVYLNEYISDPCPFIGFGSVRVFNVSTSTNPLLILTVVIEYVSYFCILLLESVLSCCFFVASDISSSHSLTFGLFRFDSFFDFPHVMVRVLHERPMNDAIPNVAYESISSPVCWPISLPNSTGFYRLSRRFS